MRPITRVALALAVLLAVLAIVVGLRLRDDASMNAAAGSAPPSTTTTSSTTTAPPTTTTLPPAATTTELPVSVPSVSDTEPEAPQVEEVAPAPPTPSVGTDAWGYSTRLDIPDEYWDRMAYCETAGNWADYPGYRWSGGLGIYTPGWLGYGGGEFAPSGGEATREEQIIVANRIAAVGLGGWGCLTTVGYP